MDVFTGREMLLRPEESTKTLASAFAFVIFWVDKKAVNNDYTRCDYGMYQQLTGNIIRVKNEADIGGVDVHAFFEKDNMWAQAVYIVDICKEDQSVTESLISEAWLVALVSRNGYVRVFQSLLMTEKISATLVGLVDAK